MSEQVQTLNYCAHAIEDLLPFAVSLQSRAPQSAAAVRSVIRMLRDSVKFILPNCCRLIDPKDIRQAHFDLLHLPFPTIALEAPWQDDLDIEELGGFKQEPVTKRIALCWEPTQNLGALPRLDQIAARHPGGGAFVLPVFWSPGLGRWTLGLGGTFVPYENTVSDEGVDDQPSAALIANAAIQDAGLTGKGRALRHYVAEPFQLLPELCAGYSAQYGSADETVAQILLDSRDEVTMLIQTCAVINCANVELDEVPAAKALNKNRIAKGKQPFFSYKVLQLTDERRALRGAGGDGTHGTPRMHLRRGHVRRLEQRTVWVRPAMVNAQTTLGHVAKDYRVKPPSNPLPPDDR